MARIIAKKAVDTSTLGEFDVMRSHTANGGVDIQNSAEVKIHVDDGSSHVAFDFKSLHEGFTFDTHGTPSGTIDSVIVSTDGGLAYTISHMAASFDQVLADLADKRGDDDREGPARQGHDHRLEA